MFPRFRQLPAELRQKIWRLAPGRVVRIDSIADSEREYIEELLEENERIKMNYHEDDTLLSTTKTPVILRICHESRQIGLKLYKLCFSQLLTPIYFAPDRDTVWFWDSLTIEAFTRNAEFWSRKPIEAEHDIKSIKSIAINTCRSGGNVQFHVDFPFFGALKHLTGLEEIGIVVNSKKVKFSVVAGGVRKVLDLEVQSGSEGEDIVFETSRDGVITMPKVRAMAHANMDRVSLL